MDTVNKAPTEAAAGFAAAEAAALASRKPYVEKDPNTGLVYLHTPQGDGGWARLDVTGAMPAPLRTIRTVKVTTAAAFVQYMKLFASTKESVVFSMPPRFDSEGCESGSKFQGRIDYDVTGQPSHGSHIVSLDLPHTDDWNEWAENDREPMGQKEFVVFLEDHMRNIAEPKGAALIELAAAFEALGQVEFTSVENLRNGTRQVKYVETIQEVPKDGSIKIPDEITLLLAPYEGTSPRPIKARIRYTLERGTLKMRYELIDARAVATEAYGDARQVIVDGLKEHVRDVIDAAF